MCSVITDGMISKERHFLRALPLQAQIRLALSERKACPSKGSIVFVLTQFSVILIPMIS